ncbi:pyridoxamine 5'-phosphate oxidase family protein [Prauserella alba]|uniref:Pyridoxamine 5'-phosphate oxidase family protein n=1 Tax=Prauserella alba TaxID=176898 RepID=A0ABN1VS96_9PSEU|nr:pyridoxamine 5'-phosphate oxidase family protein [Prauserella alba]MCP2180714.1 Pyridoxamine 5'-phosphate oxidase [Prauserella alba]
MQVHPVVEAIPPVGRGTGIDAQSELEPLPWDGAERRLNADAFCWLATVRPDGAPHVAPLFAVWSGSRAYVSSKDTARKSRNLTGDSRCVLTTDVDAAHVIVEGRGVRVSDQDTLRRASEAFEAVYGWPTTVAGDLLDAPFGAPTSGGPPYAVFEIEPETAFAFPLEGTFLPTRWRFL